MPTEYSWEIREQAEELYIINGLTYDQVASHTGVSVSQLKRWGKDGEWPTRRRKYRNAQAGIRHDVMIAKANLIRDIVTSQDPQKAFAFNSLVNAGLAIEKEAAAGPQIQAGPRRIIKTPQDAIDALREAVQQKINTMLTEPDALSFTAIKDTKQAMELVEQLAAKYKPVEEETSQAGGLSDEAAEAIRKQILGL